MHTEAFSYTRQTLGYPPPRLSLDQSDAGPRDTAGGPLRGDVSVPGGTFMLGAAPEMPFVFDNEKWAHPVEVAPFAIAHSSSAALGLVAKKAPNRSASRWGTSGGTVPRRVAMATARARRDRN